MIKYQEFLLRAYVLGGWIPRHAGKAIGIPPKQVDFYCEKWADRNWYEYGVSVDLGWLTEAGRAEFERNRTEGR